MTRQAPDFTLPSTDGEITLSALGGKVVLYFYPRDDTPGCTLEAQDFDRLAPQFAAAGAKVIGISRDTLASHQKFCGKHGLGITLASDTGTVAEDYGVWVEKNLYGKKSMGIERSTFLIADGRILSEWRKVKVAGHAEAVLAAAQTL
ncbi:peroxiredoxin [Falsirhodobacter sp. 20TX0035]|uniref:peroxiredoxin n=1 Tax=Falsirhodobacter sp. 20TX0035 TaxID=3022019 RepID=UPI00232B48D5|nr:peroxiredoxin [Falsirhodobacter sp. 20TX0035]MDB6453577.1 peroxiredoxin [Falsirhodobacter sp. 20TX0035]